MRFFDTHCHLDDEQFDADREMILARAHDAGLVRIVTVGTTLHASQKCVRLAEQHPILVAAVGIQPNYAAEATDSDWEEIVQLAQAEQVVALGETGLDRYWDHTPFAKQQDYFDRHLRLSQATGLPFVVHMRDCETEVLEMLETARLRGPLAGVMHSFTGSLAAAQRCLELGLYMSFAGMVTYKKSDALREVARQVPFDRLLVETDAPYLSPHPKRAQRPNEPALVVHTATCLAEVHDVSLAAMAEQTTTNAFALFSNRDTR